MKSRMMGMLLAAAGLRMPFHSSGKSTDGAIYNTGWRHIN